MIDPRCLAGAADRKEALTFQLRVEGGDSLTLRASSQAAKQAWLEHLEAAVAGGRGAQSISTVAVPAHPPALKMSASTSSTEDGSEAAAPVPRKISTTVFQDEKEMAAGSEAVPEDEPAPERERVAAEEVLLAAIAAQAAKRQPTAQEAAVLREVVAVVEGYVREAGARLQGLTQRVVSSGLLLERASVLRQDLLRILLEPGAAPPCVD